MTCAMECPLSTQRSVHHPQSFLEQSRRRWPTVLAHGHEHVTDAVQGADERDGALPQTLGSEICNPEVLAEQLSEDPVAHEDVRSFDVVPLLALDLVLDHEYRAILIGVIEPVTGVGRTRGLEALARLAAAGRCRTLHALEALREEALPDAADDL